MSNSSHSGSSGNSHSNVILMMQKDKDDAIMFGNSVRLNRSGTVKRAGVKQTQSQVAEDETSISIKSEPIESHPHPERYRRSLDSTYRRSLESISEYKTKHAFSTSCIFPSRETSSMDSSSSDFTDLRHADTKDKPLITASSSYLSWIDSVNSEYFGSGRPNSDVIDVEAKVGEWNNFWLNYNSPNNRYLSSPYLSASNDEKTGEDFSDCKSTCSTNREFTDKQISIEQVYLSHEEVLEALRCSQRLTEILQNALKRNENDLDDSRNDSYFSQLFPLLSHFRLGKQEPAPRERRAYSLEPQELQRQKQNMFKPNQPQSGNSCINVLLNSGVADILKKVINKRREFIGSEEQSSTARSSFSDWSSTK